MNTVYIVVTVLNGYKNIASVFATENDAERYADNLRNNWTYAEHEVYVCEYCVCEYID